MNYPKILAFLLTLAYAAAPALAETPDARFNCLPVAGGYAGIPDDLGVVTLSASRHNAHLLGLDFFSYKQERGTTRTYSNGIGFTVAFPTKMLNGKKGNIVLSQYQGNPREELPEDGIKVLGTKKFECSPK